MNSQLKNILKSISFSIGAVFIIAIIFVILTYFFFKEGILEIDFIKVASKFIGLLIIILILGEKKQFKNLLNEYFNLKLLFVVTVVAIICYIITEQIPNFIFNKHFTNDSLSLFSALSIFIISPVFEELFFRGIIQKMLHEKQKWYIAILISSLLFTGFHTNLDNYYSLFIFSLISGYLFFKYSSLKSSILFHFLSNLLIFLTPILLK